MHCPYNQASKETDSHFCGFVAWLVRMITGPAKSTPVYENASSSFKQNEGRGGGGGLL